MRKLWNIFLSYTHCTMKVCFCGGTFICLWNWFFGNPENGLTIEIKCGSIKFHKQGKQLSAPGYYLSKFSGHRYHQIRRNSEIKKVFSSSTKWPLTRIKPLSTNINIQQAEEMDNLDYNRLKKWIILVCYIMTKIIKFFAS